MILHLHSELDQDQNAITSRGSPLAIGCDPRPRSCSAHKFSRLAFYDKEIGLPAYAHALILYWLMRNMGSGPLEIFAQNQREEYIGLNMMMMMMIMMMMQENILCPRSLCVTCPEMRYYVFTLYILFSVRPVVCSAASRAGRRPARRPCGRVQSIRANMNSPAGKSIKKNKWSQFALFP